MKNILIEAVSALVLLIPLFVFLRKRALYILFSLYLAAVYHIVGLPTVQFLTFDATLVLIPFLPMAEDLRNSVLNILLFIPLGFFLPLLWRKYRRMSETLLVGFCTTLAIELGQLLTYRATDINDIITNFAGCWLGYLLFRFVYLLSGKRLRPNGKQNDLWLTYLGVAVVMFFLQPPLASLLYKLT